MGAASDDSRSTSVLDTFMIRPAFSAEFASSLVLDCISCAVVLIRQMSSAKSKSPRHVLFVHPTPVSMSLLCLITKSITIPKSTGDKIQPCLTPVGPIIIYFKRCSSPSTRTQQLAPVYNDFIQFIIFVEMP